MLCPTFSEKESLVLALFLVAEIPLYNWNALFCFSIKDIGLNFETFVKLISTTPSKSYV